MNQPNNFEGGAVRVGSDCYPYSIIARTNTRIEARKDNYKPATGFDYYSNQVYDYEFNPLSGVEVFTLRKNGRWVKKGSDMWHGISIVPGSRRCYQDPSF